MTLKLLPNIQAKRPYELPTLTRLEVHTLTEWLMCEHKLEIETGRWSRTPPKTRILPSL